MLFEAPFVAVASADHDAVKSSGLRPGDVFPLDLFCALPHAIRSADGGMTGFTDNALASIGRKRRVMLALPQFYAVALAVAQGDLIATIPRQFAESFAESLGLTVYRPPVEIQIPEIRMYWHSRHDDEPAHSWLRGHILSTIEARGFGQA